eukprot:2449940-Rhodomonas_salina.2
MMTTTSPGRARNLKFQSSSCHGTNFDKNRDRGTLQARHTIQLSLIIDPEFTVAEPNHHQDDDQRLGALHPNLK